MLFNSWELKVSVLFPILFLIKLPFSLLLGIVSRYYQGAPCGCKTLSVWSLLIWSPLPRKTRVSFLSELLCVFWHGLLVPFYLPTSHHFDIFCKRVTSDLNILNRFASLPQFSPSLLGVRSMLTSLGLCLNPWLSDDELFHRENWTSPPSFCFLSFKLVISPQD